MRKILNYSFSFNLELNRFTVVLKISCRILEIIQLQMQFSFILKRERQQRFIEITVKISRRKGIELNR